MIENIRLVKPEDLKQRIILDGLMDDLITLL
jgi:hypothetical protein